MHLSIPGINLTPEYLNAYCECRINSGLKNNDKHDSRTPENNRLAVYFQ